MKTSEIIEKMKKSNQRKKNDLFLFLRPVSHPPATVSFYMAT